MSVAKILLVDDNNADISLLRMALDGQDEKYELEILRSGEDAIRYIQGHSSTLREPDPCVIILDLHLPRYDGLAILKAIRRSSDLAHIHVIILSGFASPAEQEGIASLGGLYVQKPFQLTEFLELGAKIMEICNSSATMAL
jgi:CheY-like chemotaxis protein